jgi:hypothetical protein
VAENDEPRQVNRLAFHHPGFDVFRQVDRLPPPELNPRVVEALRALLMGGLIVSRQDVADLRDALTVILDRG